MNDYRLYFLDDAGRIRGVSELFSAGDADAVEQAKRCADGRAAELWQRARMVRRLDRRQPLSAGLRSSAA